MTRRQLVICPKCGNLGRKTPEMFSCGDKKCRCKGKERIHGPYWAVYHNKGGKRLHHYIGKAWPEEPSDEAINYMIQAGVAKSREEAIKHYKKVNAPRDNKPK